MLIYLSYVILGYDRVRIAFHEAAMVTDTQIML